MYGLFPVARERSRQLASTLSGRAADGGHGPGPDGPAPAPDHDEPSMGLSRAMLTSFLRSSSRSTGRKGSPFFS